MVNHAHALLFILNEIQRMQTVEKYINPADPVYDVGLRGHLGMQREADRFDRCCIIETPHLLNLDHHCDQNVTHTSHFPAAEYK